MYNVFFMFKIKVKDISSPVSIINDILAENLKSHSKTYITVERPLAIVTVTFLYFNS